MKYKSGDDAPRDGKRWLWTILVVAPVLALEAIAHFRHTLRFKPDEAQAHYTLAGALSLKKNRAEAVKELNEALRLRSDYPEARELLQRLDR